MVNIQRGERHTVFLNLPSVWTFFDKSDETFVPKDSSVKNISWQREDDTVNHSLLSFRNKEGKGANVTKSCVIPQMLNCLNCCGQCFVSLE